MFPTLRFRLSGMDPNGQYAVVLEFVPVDSCRYRFVNGQWGVSGRGDHSVNEATSQMRLYAHPDSPAPGRLWMKSPVSFHKVKLTNNLPTEPRGHVSLITSAVIRLLSLIWWFSLASGVASLNAQVSASSSCGSPKWILSGASPGGLLQLPRTFVYCSHGVSKWEGKGERNEENFRHKGTCPLPKCNVTPRLNGATQVLNCPTVVPTTNPSLGSQHCLILFSLITGDPVENWPQPIRQGVPRVRQKGAQTWESSQNWRVTRRQRQWDWSCQTAAQHQQYFRWRYVWVEQFQ